MKKVLNVLMVVAVSAVLLQSCKSKPSESKLQGVAESFIKSMANEDFDKAMELGTAKTDAMVEQTKVFAMMAPDSVKADLNVGKEQQKNATINFGTTTINEAGTEATITFTRSTTPDTEETIVLVKEDKNWLVDLEPMNN